MTATGFFLVLAFGPGLVLAVTWAADRVLGRGPGAALE